MNMPLASCLPDFGPDDTPKTIEDHTPPSSPAYRQAAGASRPAPGKPATRPADARPAAPAPAEGPKDAASAGKGGRLKSAGDTLKSVVRHIKLVDQPTIAPLVEPTPPVDIDALLKEHSDKVRAEEAAKAKAALAAAIAEERKAHEEQRRKEREAWVKAESSRLAERLGSSLAELEESLSRSVVQIFAPFLKGAVRDKALAELHEAVLALLGETGEQRIEIAGPPDLVDSLRAMIVDEAPERAGRFVFTANESADVRVVAGDTVCATQLSVWNRRIESAIGPH